MQDASVFTKIFSKCVHIFDSLMIVTGLL